MSTPHRPHRRGLRITGALAGLATFGAMVAAMPPKSALADAPSVDKAIAAADATLPVQTARVGANTTAFERTKVVQGDRGTKMDYVNYQMTYQGVKVVGGEMVITADEFGKVHHVSRDRIGQLPSKVEAKITADQASAVAKKGLIKVDAATTPELIVFAGVAQPVSAYKVHVEGTKQDAEGHVGPAFQDVYVDATSGAELHRTEWASHASGNGYHNGTVNVDNNGRTFNSTSAKGFSCAGSSSVSMPGNGNAMDQSSGCVDVEYAVEQENRMLTEWLGRNGMDGRGNWAPANVGLDKVNAFWNGRNTNYGHNKANNKQLTPIDVVAHEYGHAIHQYSGSAYGEDDGVGEAFGDMFGAATEAFANNPNDRPDYVVGETVDLAGKGPIRYMYDPSLIAGTANCWKPGHGGEVHIAAGPLNHWFYLLAEGSNPTNGQPKSPTCNNQTIQGAGVKAAIQVFHAGMQKATGTSTHEKIRSWTLQAAIEQTPGNCDLYNKTNAAWNGINLTKGADDPKCNGSSQPTPTATPTSNPTTSPTTPAPGGGEIAVTNANVDEVIAKSSSQPVIFVVGADWSSFTKRQLPLFRSKLAADKNGWTLAYVNGALYKQALAKFDIRNYPTVIAYSDGAEMTDPARFADGTRSQADINAYVDNVVAKWKQGH